ncbi:MAG: hypothetical protein ABW049_01055 [Spongiibacteraceae bacterium]
MRKTPWLIFVLLSIWLAACYGLRYGLMENTHWVNVCDGTTQLLACDVRKTMGLVIHFGMLSSGALALALAAWLMRGHIGTKLAWVALVLALPALVLYTATAASFALLIAALRLTRSPRLAS